VRALAARRKQTVRQQEKLAQSVFHALLFCRSPSLWRCLAQFIQASVLIYATLSWMERANRAHVSSGASVEGLLKARGFVTRSFMNSPKEEP